VFVFSSFFFVPPLYRDKMLILAAAMCYLATDNTLRSLTMLSTSIAFRLYSGIRDFASPYQPGEFIQSAGHNVEQLFCRLNLYKDKSLSLEMTENQEFATSIYTKFLSGFHRDHHLPARSKHSSAETLAYYTPIPSFHSHLLHKQSQYFMISLTALSNGKPAQNGAAP
jgi:hypothetical protein